VGAKSIPSQTSHHTTSTLHTRVAVILHVDYHYLRDLKRVYSAHRRSRQQRQGIRRRRRARDGARAVDARSDCRVHELVQSTSETDAAQAVARHAPLAQLVPPLDVDLGRVRGLLARREALVCDTRGMGELRLQWMYKLMSGWQGGRRRTCSSRTIHSERRISALASGAVVYRPRYVHCKARLATSVWLNE
jgi:hypothetical protein